MIIIRNKYTIRTLKHWAKNCPRWKVIRGNNIWRCSCKSCQNEREKSMCWKKTLIVNKLKIFTDVYLCQMLSVIERCCICTISAYYYNFWQVNCSLGIIKKTGYYRNNHKFQNRLCRRTYNSHFEIRSLELLRNNGVVP